jgi:hypothetical protein
MLPKKVSPRLNKMESPGSNCEKKAFNFDKVFHGVSGFLATDVLLASSPSELEK